MSTIEQELPATLDEKQENVVQMQKINRLTVEPGVMKLPVSRVTTSDNSPQWVIDLEHPIEGDLRFHRDKPVQGYDPEEGIVQMLRWYGIYDDNPYKLQTEFIFVENVGRENSETMHDWELLSPDYFRDEPDPTRREKVKGKYASFKQGIRNRRPTQHGVNVALLTIVGVLATPTLLLIEGTAETGAHGLLLGIISLVISALLILFLTTPPEE